MNKIIIVINGTGGCGKDTLCNIAAEQYRVGNISSITPIKNMAAIVGWNGAKTNKDRKFLADLKTIVTEYNDGTNEYILKQVEYFSQSIQEILFVHIREPEMINHFKETASKIVDFPIKTLLVKRDAVSAAFGNKADDEVENYKYDYTYYNNSPLEKASDDFIPFLKTIINDDSNTPPNVYKASFFEKFVYPISICNNTDKIWDNYGLRVMCDDGIICNDTNSLGCIPLPTMKPKDKLIIELHINAKGYSAVSECCCAVVNENLNMISEDNIYTFKVDVSL